MLVLRLSSLDAAAVEQTASFVATQLSNNEAEFEILGPAPANILRVANRYRWQIMLKIPPSIQPELLDWNFVRSLIPASVSLTIDVDPLHLM